MPRPPLPRPPLSRPHASLAEITMASLAETSMTLSTASRYLWIFELSNLSRCLTMTMESPVYYLPVYARLPCRTSISWPICLCLSYRTLHLPAMECATPQSCRVVLPFWSCLDLIVVVLVVACVPCFEPAEGSYLIRTLRSRDSSRHGRDAECNSAPHFLVDFIAL